jgi:hypothetical protein
MRILAVFAAAVGVASCASDAPPLMGTRHLKPSADQKVCHRSPTLGSNSVKRECRTVAEWAALTRAGAADVQDVERSVAASATAEASQ